MKYCVMNLFDLQTTILKNYTLSNLLKFFMNSSETKRHLYDTIIPTRSTSKKELALHGKEIPRTFKYSVYAEKQSAKLIIKLCSEGLSDIEAYDVVLTNQRPTIKKLKTLTKFIVSRYRPIPTRVDSKFSHMARKYSDYLKCYQVKRNWQNGHITKYPRKKPASEEYVHLVNWDFENFLIEVSEMNNTYKAFTKILIDFYKSTNEKKYSGKNLNHTLYVKWSGNNQLSIELDNAIDQTYYNEIINIEDFSPANSFFENKADFIEGISKCVAPTFQK